MNPRFATGKVGWTAPAVIDFGVAGGADLRAVRRSAVREPRRTDQAGINRGAGRGRESPTVCQGRAHHAPRA
jgi:hypothetical protein